MVRSRYLFHIIVNIINTVQSSFFADRVGKSCKPTVFEILLTFSQNKDWKKSFYQIIPQRKVDKGDEVGGLHQSTADTNEQEDQPFSPQHETSCDYKTDGTVTYHSLVEVGEQGIQNHR